MKIKLNKYRKFKLRVGDMVQVISGNSKTKVGKVKVILKRTDKVIIENINMRVRHRKSAQKDKNGTIDKIEAPIHISNVKKVKS